MAGGKVSDIDRQLGFSWERGNKHKEAGLDSVEEHNPSFVEIMRKRARELVAETGRVTSDDLRRYARVNGIAPDHPNAWGAVFGGKEWVQIGRMKSKLTSNHAREIRIWTLRENKER